MNNHDGTSLPHQRLPIFSSVHQPRPLLDGQKKSISNKKKNRSTCSLPTLLWFMIVVVGIVVCFSFFHFTHDHPTEIISKWFHTSLSVPYDQSDSKLPPQHELETHSHNKNNKNQVKNDEKVNKSAASTKGENVKNLNLSMMENLDGAHLELRNDKTKESLLHLKKAQQKVIRNVVQQLQSHPLHRFHTNNTNHGIEDYLLFLSRQSECKDIPIFVSMANVFSELYWQM
jgi:cytoskeletal protein RodZ